MFASGNGVVLLGPVNFRYKTLFRGVVTAALRFTAFEKTDGRVKPLSGRDDLASRAAFSQRFTISFRTCKQSVREI
jgi:hypothetical protein